MTAIAAANSVFVPPPTNNAQPAPGSPPGPPPGGRAPDDYHPVPGAPPTKPTETALLTSRALGGFAKSLEAHVSSHVDGWHPPHFEKASFPYRVERQTHESQSAATRLTSDNQRHIRRSFSTRTAVLDLLNEGLADAGMQSTLTKTHPLVSTLKDALETEAGRTSRFQTRGKLFSMGWGSGDQEAPSGTIPADARTVAARFIEATRRPDVKAAFEAALKEGAISPC